MKRLLVTGASGLLGINLALQAAGRYQVIGSTHSQPLKGVPFEVIEIDLSQPGQAAHLLNLVRPDAVINCVALTNIDQCESSPELSACLNIHLPGELAEETARRGMHLLHISTDAVFDGLRGNYSEEDLPNPLSQYARDKLQGEQAVSTANPQAIIARTNLFGWSLLGSRSLAEFFYYNLSAGRKVNGFTDVTICPLLANDLSDLLLTMLEKELSGLYNTFSRETLSKYEFGVALAQRFHLDSTLIQPISVADSGLQARRSPNLTMQVSKLEAALGQPMPGLPAALDRFYQLSLQKYPQRLRNYASRA